MFDERLKKRLAGRMHQRDREVPELRPSLPPSPVALSRGIQMVTSADESTRMAFELASLPVAFVGIDSEFRHGPPADEAEVEAGWQDVSQLYPISIGLAAFTRHGDGFLAVRYCVDVRKTATLAGLEAVLRGAPIFVVHHMKSEYMALRALGLPWPAGYFDTWLAAHLLGLGRFHARYEDQDSKDEQARAESEETAKAKRRGAAALLSLTQRYGVVYPFSGDKDAMRERYAVLPDAEPLSSLDGEYVCADAFAAAALHLPMRMDLLTAGLSYHYDRCELPAAVEFAEMEWDGVPVNSARIKLARQAALAAVEAYETKLAPYGFRTEQATPSQLAAGKRAKRVMVTSYDERKKVLGRLGLLRHFRDRTKERGYSFEKKRLKQHRHLHEVLNLLYLHNKFSSILRDKLFSGQYVGADGRVHPYIHPLGADSGRVSMKRPNLLGIGKVLRPIVTVEEPGWALVELDFAQEEIFITAAHFADDALLSDCNRGDVYCQMVRTFSEGELLPEDRDLDDESLSANYSGVRAPWKIVTLGVLYGMTDDSVAAGAKISRRAAERLRSRFFGRYHGVRGGIEAAQMQLQTKGYAETATGLKRYRKTNGPLSLWERHWAVNLPIQGGGAATLKIVLPRVARFLRAHGGRVVLTIHDALLMLVPVAKKAMLVEGAKALMIDGLKELYPSTDPRVDVNDVATSCWNHKGFSDSIDRFLEDPEFDFKRTK